MGGLVDNRVLRPGEFSIDPAGASHPSPQSGSVVWFISFGDLLTLLVCFFLVLTPWDKLQRATNNKAIQEVKMAPRGLEGLGTTLAHNATSATSPDGVIAGHDPRFRLLAEIPIYLFQVAQPSLSGLNSLAESISLELKRTGSAATSIVIRLCDDTIKVEEVAMTVGRLVEAERLKNVAVAVGYPTAGCDESDVMRPVTDTVVGVVTVIGRANALESKS
jgi:hypothetical protein